MIRKQIVSWRLFWLLQYIWSGVICITYTWAIVIFSPHFQSLDTPFSASYLEMACQKLCWWKESRKLFGRRQRKSLLKWWWSGGPLLFPLFLSTIHTVVKYGEKGVLDSILTFILGCLFYRNINNMYRELCIFVIMTHIRLRWLQVEWGGSKSRKLC